MDLRDLAGRRTVRLTTRGRKSGKPRMVTIWFVVVGPRTLHVQHSSPKPAEWYRNLVREPAVQVDFGAGPVAARAAPINDQARVGEVLRAIRRKYWLAWVFQVLGWRHEAVAAEIVLDDGGEPSALNRR